MINLCYIIIIILLSLKCEKTRSNVTKTLTPEYIQKKQAEFYILFNFFFVLTEKYSN